MNGLAPGYFDEQRGAQLVAEEEDSRQYSNPFRDELDAPQQVPRQYQNPFLEESENGLPRVDMPYDWSSENPVAYGSDARPGGGSAYDASLLAFEDDLDAIANGRWEPAPAAPAGGYAPPAASSYTGYDPYPDAYTPPSS